MERYLKDNYLLYQDITILSINARSTCLSSRNVLSSLKGLFINHLTQIGEERALPWCFARANEVGYKGIAKGTEGVKKSFKIVKCNLWMQKKSVLTYCFLADYSSLSFDG